MTGTIADWWRALPVIGKLVLIAGIIAIVLVVLVVVLGPKPPPEVPYP